MLCAEEATLYPEATLRPEAVLAADDGGRPPRAEEGRRALQPSDVAEAGREGRAEDGRAGGLEAPAPDLCW